MPGQPRTRAKRAEEAVARSKGRSNRADVGTRREALKLAAERGDDVAAKRYGVAESTIRKWRARLAVEATSPGGENVPPAAVSVPAEAWGASAAPVDPLAEAEQRAGRSWQVASEALEKAAEAVAKGDAQSARNLSIVMGVLCDKSSKIEAGIEKLRESRSRVEASRAEALREVLTLWCSALGMPLQDHARRLLGDLLRQTTESGRLAVREELAVPAREEVREHWQAVLAREAAVAAVRAGEADDDEDDDEGEEDGAVEEAEEQESEPPPESPRGPELVPLRRGCPPPHKMSRAEIEKVAKEAGARQRDGSSGPGFLAGRRSPRPW